jgi:hypothetical protein
VSWVCLRGELAGMFRACSDNERLLGAYAIWASKKHELVKLKDKALYLDNIEANRAKARARSAAYFLKNKQRIYAKRKKPQAQRVGWWKMGIEYTRRVGDTDWLAFRCDMCHAITSEFDVCRWAAKDTIDKTVRAVAKSHGYVYCNNRHWLCSACSRTVPETVQLTMFDVGKKKRTK